MRMPFPGMDPYLEHPALWPGVHNGLIAALLAQLQPLLMPRYVAAIEQRVYIEGTRRQRIPDLHVQKGTDGVGGTAVAQAVIDTRHVLSVPEAHVREAADYDYLACVTRWPRRRRFELYRTCLRERLPRVGLPLTEPDADVPLDMQAALEQAYRDGGYALRLRYDQPCDPP